jgi:dihydroneopterin aldolase
MNQPYDKILIQDLIVECLIGVYAHEHNKRQRVRLNMEILVAPRAPGTSDALDTTIDYADLIQRTKTLMQARHRQLVETLADEIAALVLENPRALGVEIKLEKPDILPDAVVGVAISRRK